MISKRAYLRKAVKDKQRWRKREQRTTPDARVATMNKLRDMLTLLRGHL